ncbi:transcriptional coactivator p100 [Moesziomyces antarcticus T-34]|uniref:Transcriptional coactivator p100 n=1 Tax=Pseudozyma antarctica (strain T-34) TaxID=1151754 RepID=M9M7C5_PSEA3|nr:transcriptional coactivator p100 [Moesziomyces antarcticus T-34]
MPFASAASAASTPAGAAPPPTNGAPATATPAAPLVPALKSAIVRSVLSGDTIVIRPKGVNIPGKEETVHIAGIAAPRLGSRDREDDPQAFPSREYLRLLTVGREIRYRIEYTVPAPAAIPGSAVAQPRQFAHVFLPPKAPGLPDTNVAHDILAAGWAKVHDSVARRADDADEGSWKQKLRAVQDEATAAGVGLWGPDDLLKVHHSMPEDTAAFLAEWKGKPIESIVEQVRDGSMLRVRLLLSSTHQQMINLSLAGIKAPRVAGGGGASPTDASEPFGEEAKFFVESRLLQRNIKVTLLSVPQPVAAPTPFANTASAAPAPAAPSASVLIGLAIHPVGDIAHFLLAAGLARCVDWHAGMLASYGGMEKYRQAERAAKEKRLNLWQSYSAPASASTALSSQPVAQRTFDAVVTRIISGDTVQVRRRGADGKLGPERRIQFSSLRQPQAKDAKQAGYAAEAREFLRKRLVGKNVSVQMDYIKPKDGDFDEREYATVKQGNKDADIGLLLISKGLATVQRHRRDDEDRSPDFDTLIEAEAKAIAEAKGIHSGKELPAPRMGDASESASKANTFLPGLKRAGRIAAVVDFVASASRFKLIVPRENVRLTFVLAGIRAPKTARNASEKDEPFGREGLDFSTLRALQRDVEIEVFSTDKVGGFIGALYLNKSDNLAIALVDNGLASVHGYSAESTPFYKQLLEAEDKAKKAQLGVWQGYDAAAEEAAYADAGSAGAVGGAGAARGGAPAWGGASNGRGAAAAAAAAPAPARTEYVDCIISDVRGSSSPDEPFGFSVQVLNDQIQELETLMHEFSLHHQSPIAAGGAHFIPRAGDLVSAKFSQDGAWYRAVIRKVSPGLKEAQVSFIDYGNQESVSFKNLRPLDAAKFGRTRLAAQAKEARLSFIRLYDGKQAEYVEEALDRFRAIAAEGKKMIANIDYTEPGTNIIHVSLYDPEAPEIGKSPELGCVNYELAREGYALLDTSVRYWKSYPAMTKALASALDEARSRHRGCFEYGDPTED